MNRKGYLVGVISASLLILPVTASASAGTADAAQHSPASVPSQSFGTRAALHPRVEISTPACGDVEFPSSAAGSWAFSGGVDVFSNGPSDEGGYNDCSTATSTVGGVTAGEEWQCPEFVNRLYLTEGWITGPQGGSTPAWPGSAGPEFYNEAPSNLTKELNGSVTYLGPGDVVDINVFNYGSPDGGHVLVVNDDSDVTNGTVNLVSQNSGSGTNSEPVVQATISGGNLTNVTGGDAEWTYAVYGVIHAPVAPTVIGSGSQDGTDMVSLEDPGTGRNIFYVGTDGAVNQFTDQNGVWTNVVLGGDVESGTTLTAVEDPGTGRNIFYVGTDGAVNQFTVQNGVWTNVVLGGDVETNTGLTSIYDPGTGRNVFYVGTNGAVNQLSVQNGDWVNVVLGGAVEPGTTLTALEDPGTGRNVFYVGTNGAVNQLSVQNGDWVNVLLGGTVEPDALRMATTTTPTVNRTSVSHGSKVTYKATVSSLPGAPTGTVSFAVGSLTLCTATLKSKTATCKSGKAPTGSDTVTATYSGDSTFAPSTGTANLTVTPITTAIAAKVDPTSATKGQKVTYSATVTSKEGTPGGTVVFTIDSKTICTAALKSGTATCASTTAPTGSDTVKATYKGATNFATSVGTTKLEVT
jgi:hypothetical protein